MHKCNENAIFPPQIQDVSSNCCPPISTCESFSVKSLVSHVLIVYGGAIYHRKKTGESSTGFGCCQCIVLFNFNSCSCLVGCCVHSATVRGQDVLCLFFLLFSCTIKDGNASPHLISPTRIPRRTFSHQSHYPPRPNFIWLLRILAMSAT